ncbi:hypothetical protein B0H19DRAFT_1227892 [Mycena capillaripes]|nr:hypothetical protein B0H19DRAFT_1227892 [Mycena capillaripes]
MDTNAVPATNELQGQDQPVQDDKYFFADGDCIFLAEGILFKLHKVLLCRDPESMFRDMFSLPQGQDMTALNPISLSGDSAEEFRALCWVIYALPDEIHRQAARGADVQRLIKVAKMCHKYTLPAFEAWALEMIRIQCLAPLDYLQVCSQEMLDTVMALATLCNNTELLDLVEAAWVSRLPSIAASAAPAQEMVSANVALLAGEKYGRRKFQGEVYYHLSRKIHSESSTLSPAHGFSHFQLTDQHLLHLLSGYVLLSSWWNHLRQDPLERLDSCYGHYNCTNIWNQIARELPSSEADMLAHLKSVKDLYNGRWHTFPCVQARLDTHISTLASASMADYFLGPAPKN